MASGSLDSIRKQVSQRRKSCDTVCSSNSSCFLHKRKQTNPLANSIRMMYVPRSNTTNNAVRQRVLSARLLKVRSLQNQLNDANFHLCELQQENRALKNLQTRQDKALSRYEGTSADLPKLINSHEEEIRVLTAKNKMLRKNLKDVTDQLKVKEEELMNVREQLKNLVSVSKSKNLGERKALSQQVDELKEQLKSSEEKINLLNRKLMLESKNYKFKLNTEISKHKQTQKELSFALSESDKLAALLETRGKILLPNNRKRFVTANNRSSISLTNLTDNIMMPKKERPKGSVSTNKLAEVDLDDESNQSDIKLEPISNETQVSPQNDIMVSPTENIKARLSSAGISGKDMDQLSKSIEKVNLAEPSRTVTFTSPPNSSLKLERISSTAKPSTDVKEEDITQRLDNYCNEVTSKVEECNAVVDKHRKDFQFAKTETEKLLETLRETDALNAKLKHSNFLGPDSIEIPEKDLDLAKKIWNEDFNFRQDMERSKNSMMDIRSLINADKNGNVIKKELVDVTQDSKNKLLATLRAIDNGEEIEEFKFDSNKKKLIGNFYGDLHK